MTITEVAMRRLGDRSEMAGVVIELAARWTRQQERYRDGDRIVDFNTGRMEGYVQAIALMLGLAVSETREMLRNGILTPR
jgi:hypothetical protein